MSTFYMDFVNGDDTKDGSSWANAWKTFTAGATAARTAPGDLIKIAKTPDEVSIGNISATFNSVDITLAAAQTANVDLCESAWTSDGGSDVTCDTTSALSEGSNCVRNVVKAAFTTGLAAHLTITEADLSGYTRLSFCIYSNVEIAANSLRIDLCSDTAGATAVDSFTINRVLKASRLYQLAINKGSALGASIKSVSMTVLSDLGGSDVTIRLDNIIAANELNLCAVVGKTGGPWYPVRSINGTTVKLGMKSYAGGFSPVPYVNATESNFAGYCRECVLAECWRGEDLAVQEAGTSANALITYQGGYNTSTGNKDGQTWIMPAGQVDSWSDGTWMTIQPYVRFDGISFSGVDAMLKHTDATVNGVQIKDMNGAGVREFFRCDWYRHLNWRLDGTMKIVGIGPPLHFGPQAYESGGWTGDADVSIHNLISYAVANYIRGNEHHFTGKWTFSHGATSNQGDSGVRIQGNGIYIREVEIAGHNTGIEIPSVYDLEIGKLTFGSLVTKLFAVGNVSNGGARIRIGNLASVSGSPTEVTYAANTGYGACAGYMDSISFDRYKADSRYKQHSRNGIISDHITGGQSAGWAYGGSGLSLYFNPNSVSLPLIHSFWIPVGTAAGQQLSMQVIKTSAVADCTLKCTIQGCGVDIVEEAVTLTDAWAEYQSTAFTPTFAGFVKVILYVLDGATTGDIGIDDIQVLIPA